MCYAEGHAPRGSLAKASKRLDALLDKGSSDTLRLSPTLDSRLTRAQKGLLHLNRALLYLCMGKADAAHELAAALAKGGLAAGDGEQAALLALLQATLLARNGKVCKGHAAALCGRMPKLDARRRCRRCCCFCCSLVYAPALTASQPSLSINPRLLPPAHPLLRHTQAAEADALLASLQPSSPAASSGREDGAVDPSLYPLLLRAQLALERGDVVAGLQLLRGLGAQLEGAPAVVATRVALMEQAGDAAGGCLLGVWWVLAGFLVGGW